MCGGQRVGVEGIEHRIVSNQSNSQASYHFNFSQISLSGKIAAASAGLPAVGWLPVHAESSSMKTSVLSGIWPASLSCHKRLGHRLWWKAPPLPPTPAVLQHCFNLRLLQRKSEAGFNIS